MDERCALTDLIKDQCAHCRRIPEPTPRRIALTPRIIAQWAGFCAGCGEEFASGEQIRSDGAGGWLAGCCDGDDA